VSRGPAFHIRFHIGYFGYHTVPIWMPIEIVGEGGVSAEKFDAKFGWSSILGVPVGTQLGYLGPLRAEPRLVFM
jgi:hypothetical protein